MGLQIDPKAMTAAQTAQQGQKPLHLHAPVNGKEVHVPKSALLTQGDYARHGSDLLITSPDGEQILVQDYFLTESPPTLVAEDGARISGDLAERLTGSIAPGQFAQAGMGGGARQSIGQVETMNGAVNVVHADGTKGVLHKGDAVFQGDVMQTAKGASVGVLFLDKTSLSLGGDGRMVLDQMVYDPSAGTGKASFSLVQGTFSFVSGQIAKAAPDAMALHTPVATIGIRGTLGSGGYMPQQGLTVAVLPEGGSVTGEVTITNAAGTQTINTANSAVMVTSFFNAPPPAFAFSPQQFANSPLAQVLTALPQTPVSPGATLTVQQIQNAAPALSPLGGQSLPDGSQPQVNPANANPAYGLMSDAGSRAILSPAATTASATQMFSAAAQAAIDQAISRGASIEEAHDAARGVHDAFNSALSRGASSQEALTTAGAAAVRTGLLTSQTSSRSGESQAGSNPFAAMAVGRAGVSNIGTMVPAGDSSSSRGAAAVLGAALDSTLRAMNVSSEGGDSHGSQKDQEARSSEGASHDSGFKSESSDSFHAGTESHSLRVTLESSGGDHHGRTESAYHETATASLQDLTTSSLRHAIYQTTSAYYTRSSSNNENYIRTQSTETSGTTDQNLTGTSANETLSAGAGNDSISGEGGDDVLYGYGGSDKLSGGTGSDSLIGGYGSDTLTGGTGSDFFLYKDGNGRSYLDSATRLGTDTIADFVSGTDKIVLSNGTYGLGSGGSLSVSLNSVTYIESSSALSSTGQNYSPDASAGAAILVVGASSGTGGVEVWFTTDQQQATTSNSYQIASLTGLDTGTIAVTDFQTTT